MELVQTSAANTVSILTAAKTEEKRSVKRGLNRELTERLHRAATVSCTV